MSVMESTVTQKGQVTIPAEVRARLGLRPKDKVRFEVEGDTVRLRASRIARHFGAGARPGADASASPGAKLRSPSARSEREAFERALAADVLAEQS